MDIMQNRKGSRPFLIAIAALVAAVLGGCSTSRQQPSTENSTATAATLRSRPQKSAETKPAATRVMLSMAVSSKKTTAMILAQIHEADLKEIAVGRIAEEKASTDEVRAYADQLVKDHTNADQLVVAMAQKTGARLHESKREKAVDRASGAGFDRGFLKETSSDHERLIRELEQEREDASDDDIEALIDKIMPILQQHHDLAQILMKKGAGLNRPVRNLWLNNQTYLRIAFRGAGDSLPGSPTVFSAPS